VWRHFGNLVYQYRVGALDEQMWLAYSATIKGHLSSQAWRDWYCANSEVFSTALTRQVDQALAELDVEQAEAAQIEG